MTNTIKIHKRKQCPDCKENGLVFDEETKGCIMCKKCDGYGKIAVKESFELHDFMPLFSKEEKGFIKSSINEMLFENEFPVESGDTVQSSNLLIMCDYANDEEVSFTIWRAQTDFTYKIPKKGRK